MYQVDLVLPSVLDSLVGPVVRQLQVVRHVLDFPDFLDILVRPYVLSQISNQIRMLLYLVDQQRQVWMAPDHKPGFLVVPVGQDDLQDRDNPFHRDNH